MGKQVFDQYSLLHYAAGIVAYFWDIGAWKWFAFHMGFELIENSQFGIDFINTQLTWWPGGKPRADGFENIRGDNLSAMFGWWCAYELDGIGKRRRWY